MEQTPPPQFPPPLFTPPQAPLIPEPTREEVFWNRYEHWKNRSQFCYRWLDNRALAFPAFCVRWGSRLPQPSSDLKQQIYFSENTNGHIPNTLVIANYSILRSSNSAVEHKEQVSQAASLIKDKIIIHPGEVFRIREFYQNPDIIATHSNSSDVFIWDVKSQPNKKDVVGATVSQPDLILTGFHENVVSSLAMCRTEPFVLSGGKDVVVLWSIEGHLTSQIVNQAADESSCGSSKSGPLGAYSGHGDIVADVAFCPSSAQEFCSVGDDCCLILWDRRFGSTPVHKVEKAHGDYLHCVDWNPHDCNLILTGSADNSIHMFDRRKLVSRGTCFPVHKFEGHNSAVRCVQWSPDRCSVFGSSAEDGLLNIWDYNQVNEVGSGPGPRRPPPGVFFQHIGHSISRETVVAFHWNEHDPWTVVSSSDNTGPITGPTSYGGILQIWRMSILDSMSSEELLAIDEKIKSKVETARRTRGRNVN